MIVEKYHRILAFRQRSWLAEDIHFNNEKRKDAKDDFYTCVLQENEQFFLRTFDAQQEKKISVRASATEKDCQNNLSSPLLRVFRTN
ncbi:uncharacterized protein CDAR_402011 [Caerostris darwini]|uniref:Uncharacterized protein n=1 Tax=Caerostris darwini TaxID=1538125 RepID=A0AAV4TQ75_9ARAC|nr:uncharacterized protein CDAR_402011 [Caerostris darwini]